MIVSESYFKIFFYNIAFWYLDIDFDKAKEEKQEEEIEPRLEIQEPLEKMWINPQDVLNNKN